MLEVICVALAVYFEARGESLEGQRAVASVYGAEYLDLPPNESMKIALAVASYTADIPTTPAVFFAQAGFLKYKELETIGNHVFYTTHD